MKQGFLTEIDNQQMTETIQELRTENNNLIDQID